MTYGLIGKTLIHSYSKEIQEALGRYTYDLISLSPEEMPGFIKLREYDGLNVTIPYKQDVIPLCDEISPLAQAIGAVNTLYWENPEGKTPEERGKLIGHNTDYTGFLYAASRGRDRFCRKECADPGNRRHIADYTKGGFGQGCGIHTHSFTP